MGLSLHLGYDRWDISLQGTFLAQHLDRQNRFIFPFQPTLLVSYTLWRGQESAGGPSFSLHGGIGMRSWLFEEQFSLREQVGFGLQFGAKAEWSFSPRFQAFVRASVFYMPPIFRRLAESDVPLVHYIEFPFEVGLRVNFF